MSNQEENKPEELSQEDKSVLLDHNYDGIQELDHPLPFWWMMIFAITIAFSIPYYLYYVHFDGPSHKEQLNESLAKIKTQQEEYEAKQGGFDIDSYKAFIVTKKAKKIGRKTFKRKCKACHGAKGEGGIGPNLTDSYWLNGKGNIADVYKVIDKGVEEKGMQAWGQTLGKEKMMAVTAYVMQLKGTNPPNPKEPQGTEYK